MLFWSPLWRPLWRFLQGALRTVMWLATVPKRVLRNLREFWCSTMVNRLLVRRFSACRVATIFLQQAKPNRFFHQHSKPKPTKTATTNLTPSRRAISLLEAFHEESGKRLLVQNIEVSEGDSIAVSDTLREPGIVKFEGVKMDSNGVTGIATVLGTTIRREFIVHEQALVIDSLPAGKLDLQVFFGEYSGEKPWANLNVDVVAGDTETILLTRQIGPEIEILHHDSVTLTFVASLALPEGNDSLNSVMTDIPVALRLTENNCNFDSLKSVDNGRWEAVRISKGGSRSNKLPINYASFDRKLKELVIWVRVDSLNVCDSLEIVYEGLLDPLYALDVFPTNRSYSLVWHFDSGMAAVSDEAEKGYFEGLPTGDAPADGVVGEGIKLDEGDVVVVENSAIADSSRKVNLNYDGSEYFCFSVWVQLESLDKEQKIFEKEKEYELRFDPAKGFVVNLWVLIP